MSSQEQSVRIQTSLLNPYEKVALQWLAQRMPKCVTSDHLTYIGLLGAVLIAVGYFLTTFHTAFLWLSSLGFVINWFGDSLDGTLARVRQQQRPLYGFYLDHNLDCICEFFMVAGAGLMPFMHMWSALLIIVPYMMLEIYVMINAHLKNEFKLTYSKFGPTELRVAIIILNTCLFFIPFMREWNTTIEFFEGYKVDFFFMDFGGLTIASILGIIYLVSLVKDAKYFAKIDPLKKD